MGKVYKRGALLGLVVVGLMTGKGIALPEATPTPLKISKTQQNSSHYQKRETEINKGFSKNITNVGTSPLNLTVVCKDIKKDDGGKPTKPPAIDYSAWVTAIFTGVLTIVGWFQWRAMRDSLEIAQKNSQRELQAYVTVKESMLYNIGPKAPVIGIVIKNYGKTPAYDILHEIYLDILDFPFKNITPQYIRLGYIECLPSDDTIIFESETISLTDEQREEIKRESKAIYLKGRITYRDDFGVQQEMLYERMKIEEFEIPNESLIFIPKIYGIST
jgi:hypothetical protein